MPCCLPRASGRLSALLGAHIKVNGLQRDAFHRLANGTRKPMDDYWKILRLFYGSKLHNQAIQLQGGPTLPLLRLIGRASPISPVCLLRSLLDLGADLNRLQQPCDLSPRMIFTALTAAISQYSHDPAEILEILLKYGVDIHGPGLDRPVYRAGHIPIFVAVHLMATD
ncbi:hypothetical protein N7491_011276 [Penicillium cf. griseofulvum]|nr:hypothetical protein N7491_011276 [Penicillium cf. griseofulvum]KAJ5442290.1 hypothetical protein N7445_005297 [Penicillium cf. griseofulvum]